MPASSLCLWPDRLYSCWRLRGLIQGVKFGLKFAGQGMESFTHSRSALSVLFLKNRFAEFLHQTGLGRYVFKMRAHVLADCHVLTQRKLFTHRPYKSNWYSH